MVSGVPTGPRGGTHRAHESNIPTPRYHRYRVTHAGSYLRTNVEDTETHQAQVVRGVRGGEIGNHIRNKLAITKYIVRIWLRAWCVTAPPT